MEKLKPYKKKLHYMISTIPAQFDLGAYPSIVKPGGHFTQIGMPVGFQINVSNIELASSRVNFNASLIGGIPQTQEVLHYCADNRIYPKIQVVKADEINESWEKILNKHARYRYVIDAKTF